MTNPRLHILGLKKEKRLAWLFVLPTLTFVVGVYAYPILTTLVYSVTTIDIATYTIREFVGLRNFQYIISNEFFSPTLIRTIYFGMMVVVMTILLAIGVSLLININFKGNKFLKIIILLPWAVPPVVSGVMWSQMFQYEFGFINKVIKIFGGHYLAWITNIGIACTDYYGNLAMATFCHAIYLCGDANDSSFSY